MAAFGLILFIQQGSDPVDFSTDGFAGGDAVGEKFIGFEWNGWTAWITTAAGVLLLFGAAQHALAKAFSLTVGLALAACAILGFVDGDVLGLAASNFWTSLGWAIAAGVLLLNVFAPRVGGEDRGVHDTATARRTREPAGTRSTAGSDSARDLDGDGDDDRVERREPGTRAL